MIALTLNQKVVREARRLGATVYTHRQWDSQHIALYQWRKINKPHGMLPKDPVDTIWQHITVTRPSGHFKADARLVEKIGFERFGSGVSYNWLVDMTTGEIAVGMPLTAKGTHTVNDKEIKSFSYDQNLVSVAIAVIGMPDTLLTHAAKLAISRLIAAHIMCNAVEWDFDYVPHSLVAWKDCPSDSTRNEMASIYRGAHKLVCH